MKDDALKAKLVKALDFALTSATTLEVLVIEKANPEAIQRAIMQYEDGKETALAILKEAQSQ